MAYDKAVDSAQLNAELKVIADTIRQKTGKSETINLSQFASEISSIQAGDGALNTINGFDVTGTSYFFSNGREYTIPPEKRNGLFWMLILTKMNVFANRTNDVVFLLYTPLRKDGERYYYVGWYDHSSGLLNISVEKVPEEQYTLTVSNGDGFLQRAYDVFFLNRAKSPMNDMEF